MFNRAYAFIFICELSENWDNTDSGNPPFWFSN